MDKGYITMQEKELLSLHHGDISIENIAKRCTLPLEEVRKICIHALEKIEYLQADKLSFEYPFICKDIDNFIERMGMDDLQEESLKLLKNALALAKDHPNLLNDMVDGFYIKLSEIHGLSTNTVQLKLRNIYLHSLDQKQCESQLFLKKYFPQKYQINNLHGLQMSKLLLASLECIDPDAYLSMNST